MAMCTKRSVDSVREVPQGRSDIYELFDHSVDDGALGGSLQFMQFICQLPGKSEGYIAFLILLCFIGSVFCVYILVRPNYVRKVNVIFVT